MEFKAIKRPHRPYLEKIAELEKQMLVLKVALSKIYWCDMADYEEQADVVYKIARDALDSVKSLPMKEYPNEPSRTP